MVSEHLRQLRLQLLVVMHPGQDALLHQGSEGCLHLAPPVLVPWAVFLSIEPSTNWDPKILWVEASTKELHSADCFHPDNLHSCS